MRLFEEKVWKMSHLKLVLCALNPRYKRPVEFVERFLQLGASTVRSRKNKKSARTCVQKERKEERCKQTNKQTNKHMRARAPFKDKLSIARTSTLDHMLYS